MRIRVVPTASGKHALQVVSKRSGILKVHKHIGTYSNDVQKAVLYQKAQDFIQKYAGQISLTDYLTAVSLADIIVTQSRPLFAYELLSRCYDKLGFTGYPDPLIKDLVIARLYHPSSKRALHEYIYESAGRRYALRTIYRHLKESLKAGIKERFQEALITFARQGLGDTLQLVFYDVTTLYFDSQVRTTLKDFGFSKDHRPADTQVVIGLVVNKQGFPLYFDVFSGKTFEGHTLVNVVEKIQNLLQAPELIVVADAAMLSQDNLDSLAAKGIGFIVGARLANLPVTLIDQIHTQLTKQDGNTATFTYHDHRLICQYFEKRAAKDRNDRNQQIEKAKAIIERPANIMGRYRFVKKAKDLKYLINIELIDKAEKLEGIKGCITNTNLDTQTVIDRYHDLWHIENSFRITKSDLEARPIFHRLDETIKAHFVLVFAGLAISKYIEQSTGLSIKKVLQVCSRVLTHTITNTKTGETIDKETTIQNPYLKKVIERLRAVGH
jgi:transposase